MTLTPTVTLRWVNFPVSLELIRAQAWDALPGLPARERDVAQFAYVRLLQARVEAIPGVIQWLPEASRIGIDPTHAGAAYATAVAVVDAAARLDMTPDDAAEVTRLVTGATP